MEKLAKPESQIEYAIHINCYFVAALLLCFIPIIGVAIAVFLLFVQIPFTVILMIKLSRKRRLAKNKAMEADRSTETLRGPEFEVKVADFRKAIANLKQANRKAVIKVILVCGVLCLFPFGIFIAAAVFVLGILVISKAHNEVRRTTALLSTLIAQAAATNPDAASEARTAGPAKGQKAAQQIDTMIVSEIPKGAANKSSNRNSTPKNPTQFSKNMNFVGSAILIPLGLLITLSVALHQYQLYMMTPQERAAYETQQANLAAAEVEADRKKKDAKVYANKSTMTAEAQQEGARSKSQLSALDKMAIVFKGGYTKDQIEREATTVLRLFDQSLSDANYEHLANVLLSLSDGIKPNTEMDILACMNTLKRNSGDFKLDIPYAAATCATTISAGL